MNMEKFIETCKQSIIRWCKRWVIPIGVVASIFSIMGFSIGLVNILADVKSKDAVIRNMEMQNNRLSNLLETKDERIKLLEIEVEKLKSLPNQDEIRKKFLSLPHIEETSCGIYDKKLKVHYCDNCFQNSPMKTIVLQPYGLSFDKKCPVCGATYTSLLSKTK